MKTTQELLDEYNAKSGKAPLKAWKQKRELLEQRVALLAVEEVKPLNEVAQPAATAAPTKKENDMATKKVAKKPVKKVAKKTAKAEKTVGRPVKTDGIKAFVIEQLGKDKGTREIFDAAVAKGFDTTYKSVASLVCRAKKG